MMGEEIEPVEIPDDLPYAKTTFYTCSVDLGLKNALIEKYVVSDYNDGVTVIRAKTRYRYNADIVLAVSPQVVKRIFDEWVNILKAAIPSWQGTHNSERASHPTFKIAGRMTNGKTAYVQLSVYGYNANKVGISIAEE